MTSFDPGIGYAPAAVSATTGTAAPVIPSGEEVYNMLMAGIEPELLTSALPGLTAKYANETPAEKEQRDARYKRAFELYEKAFVAYLTDIQTQAHAFHREANVSLEQNSRTEETSFMSSIQSAISQA